MMDKGGELRLYVNMWVYEVEDAGFYCPYASEQRGTKLPGLIGAKRTRLDHSTSSDSDGSSNCPINRLDGESSTTLYRQFRLTLNHDMTIKAFKEFLEKRYNELYLESDSIKVVYVREIFGGEEYDLGNGESLFSCFCNNSIVIVAAKSSKQAFPAKISKVAPVEKTVPHKTLLVPPIAGPTPEPSPEKEILYTLVEKADAKSSNSTRKPRKQKTVDKIISADESVDKDNNLTVKKTNISPEKHPKSIPALVPLESSLPVQSQPVNSKSALGERINKDLKTESPPSIKLEKSPSKPLIDHQARELLEDASKTLQRNMPSTPINSIIQDKMAPVLSAPRPQIRGPTVADLQKLAQLIQAPSSSDSSSSSEDDEDAFVVAPLAIPKPSVEPTLPIPSKFEESSSSDYSTDHDHGDNSTLAPTTMVSELASTEKERAPLFKRTSLTQISEELKRSKSATPIDSTATTVATNGVVAADGRPRPRRRRQRKNGPLPNETREATT